MFGPTETPRVAVAIKRANLNKLKGDRFEAIRLPADEVRRVDWLTVAEAAREAKVSEKTIRRWYRAGRLPVDRLGPRLVRVRRSDLLQMSKV